MVCIRFLLDAADLTHNQISSVVSEMSFFAVKQFKEARVVQKNSQVIFIENHCSGLLVQEK